MADAEESDEPETEPWLHDWSAVVSTAMGVETTPYAQLSRAEHGRWHLSARFSVKADPEAVARMISWLGPFVADDTLSSDFPRFVGHAQHEYAPRPHLLWCRAGAIEVEDLNPDDAWTEGSPTPNVRAPVPVHVVPTRLTTVQGLPGSGKTEYLAELAVEHPDWLVVDDYYVGVEGADPHPMDSRYFGTVVRAIRDGRPTVVSDVRFCAGRPAGELVEAVAELAPAQWFGTSFENDPDACRRNLESRAAREPARDLSRELGELAAWSARYHPSSPSRPVWSGSVPH